MTCAPCQRGDHGECEPVADPDREMLFTDCDCLCDPSLQRNARVADLLRQARRWLAAERTDLCVEALQRAIALILPQPRPMRRLALVGKLPDWMKRKHDSETKR
jgi:hypothetical protein